MPLLPSWGLEAVRSPDWQSSVVTWGSDHSLPSASLSVKRTLKSLSLAEKEDGVSNLLPFLVSQERGAIKEQEKRKNEQERPHRAINNGDPLLSFFKSVWGDQWWSNDICGELRNPHQAPSQDGRGQMTQPSNHPPLASCPSSPFLGSLVQLVSLPVILQQRKLSTGFIKMRPKRSFIFPPPVIDYY